MEHHREGWEEIKSLFLTIKENVLFGFVFWNDSDLLLLKRNNRIRCVFVEECIIVFSQKWDSGELEETTETFDHQDVAGAKEYLVTLSKEVFG